MISFANHLLVTGASGFLGSGIVGLAQEEGWHVRALDRDPKAQNVGVENFVGDIADSAIVRKACEGVSAVVHAAGLAHVFGSGAKDSAHFNAVNETGTANVLDAAVECGVPHVVLISSVSVYGRYAGAICDEAAPCNPNGPYAISKRRAELRAMERAKKGGISLTILRFATIYGKGDRGNVANLIRALDRGRFIWPGSGENKKSLIYREDAARACLRVLDHPPTGTKIFNVSAQPASMREIVSAICEALERPLPRLRIPRHFVRVVGSVVSGLGDPGLLGQRLQKLMQDDVYDGSRFEAAFDFHPATSISEGIRKEVEFLESQTK